MHSEPRTTPVAEAPATAGPDDLTHGAIYDVEASDPRSTLIDRSGVAPEDLRQIARVMEALGGLRGAEQRLSQASRRYMQLNETDMRALHYLIVCANRSLVATPSGIAHHLGVSTAATTKLLDRLEGTSGARRIPQTDGPSRSRSLRRPGTPRWRRSGGSRPSASTRPRGCRRRSAMW